jgi:hypothetical protein
MTANCAKGSNDPTLPAMRYFTRERVWPADPSDESFDWERDVCEAYSAHVAKIGDALPADLRLIASHAVDLHDAFFDLVEIHPRSLRMLLLGSGAVHDPQLLDLRYSDYEVVDGTLRNLSYAVEGIRPYVADYDAPPPQPTAGYMPLGQILYTEVDIIGDRFEHSFLVDPLGSRPTRWGNVGGRSLRF